MDSEGLEASQSFAYHHILFGLTLYYGLEGCLKMACQHFMPNLYRNLKRDDTVLPFFGFVMGWLITLYSTPICLHAFLTGDNHTSKNPPSVSGQLCIASRSILWVSELNRLDYISVYVKHHFGSLSHLIWHLNGGITLTPLYFIYTSLVTELFSTAAAILTIIGYKPTNSLIALRIQQTNAILVPLLRIPPVVYAAVKVLPQLYGYQRLMGAFFLSGYLWSFLRTKPREFRVLFNVMEVCCPKQGPSVAAQDLQTKEMK